VIRDTRRSKQTVASRRRETLRGGSTAGAVRKQGIAVMIVGCLADCVQLNLFHFCFHNLSLGGWVQLRQSFESPKH
jgi:hypothetical protein